MISYEIATAEMAAEVFTLLEEVAPEIPVRLDTAKHQGAMRCTVEKCCSNGASLVAIEGGRIVGFLLVTPDKGQNFQDREGRSWLNVSYGGVTKNRRGDGIFTGLMASIMARRVPLSAEVKHANQSGMAERLEKLGFHRDGPSPLRNGDEFIWEP
jgi:hypothetical protein